MKGELSLYIKESGMGRPDYPTCRLQKGLLLAFRDKDISGEGIGFGVPILKSGNKTFFPGSARITTLRESEMVSVTVDYDLNLVEKKALKGKNIEYRYFYAITENLSRLHRSYPRIRKMLMHGSNFLRRFFGFETLFEKIDTHGIVGVRYEIHKEEGIIQINVDASGIEKKDYTEIMVMNELGASHFNEYHDSTGLILKGDAIGTWDETFADEASFIDTIHSIVFTLGKVAGARMFRGREFVPGRLAWAGLAYSLPPCTDNFDYNIRIRG